VRRVSAATFYTIADGHYFPGLVALLNSLRLTGHEQDLVVLDEGLTAEQRDRLDALVTLVELPQERLGNSALSKPYPHLLAPSGVVTLIDSDIIVTRPLGTALGDAAAGKIVAYRDHETTETRWFAEWEQDFELSGPPRRQTYVNAGFVSFSQEHWPDLLTRWRQACEQIPVDRFSVLPRWVPRVTAIEREPFWAGDQDALNAILMAEVAPEALAVQPIHEEPDWLNEVEIVDRQTLACLYRGKPTALLHFSLAPKPWQPAGWKRVRRNAYVELLPRLLFANDVLLRLDPEEVVPWLRPGRSATVRRSGLAALNRGRADTERAWRRAVHTLPPSARRPLLALRDRIARQRP